MTDQDLTQIGIEAFGARRRMQQAIAGAAHRIYIFCSKSTHYTFV